MRKLLVLLLVLAPLSLRSEEIQTILSRMNAAAPGFHSMSADIEMVTLTAVIDDKIDENGTLKMKKGKNGSIRAIIDFSKQKGAARVIGFFGKTVRIYYPNAKFFQDYDLGKNVNVLNQFLLLGFGSSGDDLAKSYDIAPDGMEKVAGNNATRLLLTPKDPEMKSHLSKIELWFPEGSANPIQQQFFEPTGNYRKVTYSNLKINPPIKGDLEIQMQRGTQQRRS